MFDRKKVFASLSVESKEFVMNYLESVLGLTQDTDKENFLFPDFNKQILDPRSMHDIDLAVDRILTAIKNEEKIAIYGDYDCDGVPGTALVRDFFEKINYSRVVYYIPHRHTEGYGLNNQAIQILAQQGVSLILTIDLGTTNIAEIDFANSLGIDTIVTDHHLPHETEDGQILPKAHSVVNNKKNNCNYANKDLCGSATVYKLITLLISELRNIYENKSSNFLKSDFEKIEIKLPQSGYEKWLLDLVAIATIADMMPLVGENRVLAIYGLYVLSKTPRAGLQTLFQNSKVNLQKINETDIAFSLAPRINSASRMAHPNIALRLFSQNLEEGINAAHELEDLNTERKNVTNNIIKKIYKILDKRKSENNLPKILVVGSTDWNAGVLGILAQKVVDKYGVTTFVWGENFKGSVRGNGEVNVVKLMSACKEYFEHFGGHVEAGGFTTKFSEVHDLETVLNQNFETAKINLDNLDDQNLNKKIFDLDLVKINFDFLAALNLLGPFGLGNEKPTFKIRNYENYTYSRFGKNKEHLKIIFSAKNNLGQKLEREAIKFFVEKEDEEKVLSSLQSGNLFFEVEPGWNTTTPRLKIAD